MNRRVIALSGATGALLFLFSAFSVGTGEQSVTSGQFDERPAFDAERVDTAESVRRLANSGHWGRAAQGSSEGTTDEGSGRYEIRILGVETVDGRREALLSVDTRTLAAMVEGERLASGLVRVAPGDQLTGAIRIQAIGSDHVVLRAEDSTVQLFLYSEE